MDFADMLHDKEHCAKLSSCGITGGVMIKSFKHKGLKRFFQNGDSSGLEQSLVPRLKLRLSMLDAAKTLSFLNQPGYDLHQLKGDRADTWSVSVSGNWRITFIFKEGDVYIVNLEDYH